jgi:hypothetical protein
LVGLKDGCAAAWGPQALFKAGNNDRLKKLRYAAGGACAAQVWAQRLSGARWLDSSNSILSDGFVPLATGATDCVAGAGALSPRDRLLVRMVDELLDASHRFNRWSDSSLPA